MKLLYLFGTQTRNPSTVIISECKYTVNAINEHASKQLDKTNHSAMLGASLQ